MARTQRASGPVVDAFMPTLAWSYNVVIPADATPHPLNELGFGYFPAVIPGMVGGPDRSVRAIQVHNPLNQLPAGTSVFIGSGELIPLLCTEELLPGEREQFVIDKLSALSLANYDPVNTVIATITLIAVNA